MHVHEFSMLVKPHTQPSNQSSPLPASRLQLQNFPISGYDTQYTVHGNNICQTHQALEVGVQRLLGSSLHTPCALYRREPGFTSHHHTSNDYRTEPRGMAEYPKQV